MKRPLQQILIVLFLVAGISAASAQEVYTSSGKKGYHKKVTKKKKGYDPDRLILGGGLAAGFGNGFLNLGASPMVGYRIAENFSAGIGVGYLYSRQPVYVDPADPYKVSYVRSHIVYPSIWLRYFVFRNFFVTSAVEYDIISQEYPGYDNITGNPVMKKLDVTNTCLFVGGGWRIPLGGRVSFYPEIRYDVLQGKNSPYAPGFPTTIRFGFAVGL